LYDLFSGLVPSDSFMAAQCDMVLDMVSSIFTAIAKSFWEKNEELKVRLPVEYN